MIQQKFEDYEGFIEKFKPKKTTDDCYTPENIYNAIADYVTKKYKFDKSKIVRPFYPGGDYERFEYPDGCVVLDNPPFSIITKIVRHYNNRGIQYFLFCPSLTCFQSLLDNEHSTVIITGTSITYGNGAQVMTAFITNLGTGVNYAETDPILMEIIRAENNKDLKNIKKQVTKISLPNEFITAARMQYLAHHHVDFFIPRRDSIGIKKLDNYKKGIYGGGFLLSERAAAERAAAERAAAERAAAERIELSEREKEIQRMIK